MTVQQIRVRQPKYGWVIWVLIVVLLLCLGGCYQSNAATAAIEQGIAACKERGGVPSTFVSTLVARVDCQHPDVEKREREK